MKNIIINLFIILMCIICGTMGYLVVRNYFYQQNNKNIEQVLAYSDTNCKDASNVIENINSEEVINTTTETTTSTSTKTTTTTNKIEDLEIKKSVVSDVVDDNSIVFDGLTLTELSNKLDKHLSSTLTDTGIYFANYTKKTGLDPYLAVAIVLHETGCKWTCSSLVRNNYNIGGLKSDGKFIKYNSLEEGIDGYLNILFNNYYNKGLNTAELIQSKYAPSSTTWTEKINWYINTIKDS